MRARTGYYFAAMGRMGWASAGLAAGLLWATASTAQTGSGSANAGGGPQVYGVRARLETSLNSGKVRQGMYVEARPEAKMHLADGVELEPNSRLTGRIETVNASVGGSASAISVIFDTVKLKGGRDIPVKATILWIGSAPNLLNPTIVSAPADRTTPGVGVEAGASSVPPQQGYQGSEITGAPHRNGDGPGGGERKLPPGVAVQLGAINGVNFFSDMARNESGFFRSPKGNVSVPGGTVLAFAIVLLPVPAAASHP